MELSAGVADLHMHTTASDGTCSVADRIDQAADRELDGIAITDHDSISSDLTDRVSSERDVELVTGVEVRADVRNTKVELLGYYVDPDDEGMTGVLREVRESRRERNRQIIDRLHEVTSLDRSYNDIKSEADGILGRPHIAGVLVDASIVDSVSEAFGEYLANDGAAFVPMERIPAPRVIDAIHGANGIVSLAHPGRVRTDDIESIVADLVEAGLDGIEVPYPYSEAPSEGYSDITSETAAALADTHDLLSTGGSDCHGPDSGKFRIGEVCITRDQFDDIRIRAKERAPL